MSKQENTGTPLPQGTVCKLCKKIYIFPCNGKRYDCANAVWVRSKGKVDLGRAEPKEIKKLKKDGTLPQPNIVKAKRKRVRL